MRSSSLYMFGLQLAGTLVFLMLRLASSPYSLCCLLFGVIFLIAARIRTWTVVVGALFFLVFAGGVMILFLYRVILLSLQAPNRQTPLICIVILPLSTQATFTYITSPREFYWCGDLVFAAAALLFFAMLCAVALIDPTEGTLRRG